MKRLLNLVFLANIALAFLFVTACHDDGGVADFSFSVIAESVTEGDTVPVSLSFTKGPEDGYTLSYRIESWDSSTNTGAPVTATLLSGDAPAGGMSLSFSDSRHRDFRIKGLPRGSYMLTITLARNGKEVGESCSFVVFAGVQPPEPQEKKVTDFTLPGAGDGFKVETEGGFLYIVLDLKDYGGGRAASYRCTVYPADADDKTLSASSDTPAVATATVYDGVFLKLTPCGVGKAVVTVRSNDGGASKALGVKVVDTTTPPVPPKVTDFTIPAVDSESGKVNVECGKTISFTPVLTPSDGVPGFSAASSDPSVVTATVDGGTIRIKGVCPGYASITLSAADGPSKTFPVMVWKNVVVTVDWLELDATDSQIRTKTFPCKIRFSSDCDVAFPEPIVWNVTMKAVVNVAGHDAQSHTDSRDVRFYGNAPAYYDVMQNVLIPAWQIYRTDDFGLSLTLSMQRSSSLDPAVWRITYVDTYKVQQARIKAYLTEIQQ